MRLPIKGRISSGYAAFQLDGQVGDAAPRIEPPWSEDGLGRADVDAGAALAAVGAGRLVHRQRQVDQDSPMKNIEPALARQQQRVLAAPAQAGLFRQRQFHHRRRIREHAVAEIADLRLDALGQLLQAVAQHLVVIAAPGIHRDHGGAGVGQARRRSRSRQSFSVSLGR
jgi:hypothetical protein